MRHAPFVKGLALTVPLFFVFLGCADARSGVSPGDVPTVAEVVCEADGSTRVKTPEVVVQADGVHVHLLSRLDEPAEIIGLGRDVDPGESDWVSVAPPGSVDVGCNPFSLHGTGEEPSTTPMELLDPEGLYVPGELQCTGMARYGIGDFAEPPLEGLRVPIEAARAKIHGLDDDDEVFHIGYPEQPDAAVAVRQNGQIVATFSFVTFDGREWVIEGSSVCASSGLR
jgi:hypothetical protein